ncbi:helix-turn-helix domain-containing protein [Streptomyces sp. NPDC055078]
MAKENEAPSMAELYGSRLRRLRQARNWTQRELGRAVAVEHSRIAQIERTSGARPTLQLSRAFDRVFETDGLFEELWPHVYRETYPNWSRAFLDAQARAVEIRVYMAHTVHGLLQTPEYARALLRLGRSLKTEEQLEERVSARLARQERLNGPDAPSLLVILDESVLRRPVGGPETMRQQLARLLAATESPRVTVQVLPYSHGEHPSLGGSLELLSMPDGSTVAYKEGADFGWLVEDPEDVKWYADSYYRLWGGSLPWAMSLDMIRSLMEGSTSDTRVPAQAQRRRVAQVQSQQSGGWELRRSLGRNGRRARP